MLILLKHLYQIVINILYYINILCKRFRENGYDDIIIPIKGRIEDVTLPVEKVDAIVSEWMGYFLLFESMLDSLIFARDKYLNKNGTMLPNECNLFISGISDTGEC